MSIFETLSNFKIFRYFFSILQIKGENSTPGNGTDEKYSEVTLAENKVNYGEVIGIPLAVLFFLLLAIAIAWLTIRHLRRTEDVKAMKTEASVVSNKPQSFAGSTTGLFHGPVASTVASKSSGGIPGYAESSAFGLSSLYRQDSTYADLRSTTDSSHPLTDDHSSDRMVLNAVPGVSVPENRPTFTDVFLERANGGTGTVSSYGASTKGTVSFYTHGRGDDDRSLFQSTGLEENRDVAQVYLGNRTAPI